MLLFALLLVLCNAKVYAADMDTYTIDPEPGSSVQEISTVKITFPNATWGMLSNVSLSRMGDIKLTNKDNPTQQYGVVERTYGSFGDPTVTLKFGNAFGASGTAVVITDEGTWNLVIPAGVLKDCDEILCPEINVDFIIGGEPANDMTRYALDPSSGEVSKISSIKVSFPDTGIWGIDAPDVSGITLTKQGYPTKVYNVVRYDYIGTDYAILYFDLADAEVKEAMDIVEAGTYELNIPANSFKKCFAEEYNSQIKATYTIPSVGGDYMSDCNVTPAAGHLEKISTVTLTFNSQVGQAQYVEDADYSTIKIIKKGSEPKTVYNCVNVARHSGNQYSFVLSFAPEGETDAAEILKRGEYLLSIPSGLFYFPLGGTDWKNNAMSILYTIDAPTSATSLEEYTIDPEDGKELESFASVQLTFPGTTQGLQYPFDDLSNVKLVVRTFEDDAENEYGTVGSEFSVSNDKVVKLAFAQPTEPFTAPGEYTVTIPSGTFYEDGNPNATNTDISVTYTIPLPKILAESISLDETEKTIEEGMEFTLTATVLPEDATNKTVEWSSSDTSVATVDEEGKVTVIGVGECQIIAKTTDGTELTAECRLSATASGIDSVLAGTGIRYDVYSVNGILVKGNATADDVKKLAAGIYIINGKKYIIK